MRTLMMIVMVALATWAGGCAGTGDATRATPGSGVPATESRGADPLGRGPESPPRAQGLRLDQVFPFIARDDAGAAPLGRGIDADFDVVEGPHAGRVLNLAIRRVSEERRWRVERRIAESGRVLERRVQEMRDGPSLYLVEFWNDERGVRVVFEPDPLTMPAVLMPGLAVSAEQKMSLPTIENPRRIRERGTGRMDLTYEAEQEITTPFGVFTCARTREVYTSKLKNATAVRTIDRWYDAELGLVAERWEETVSILGGIVVERTTHAMRLREPPRAAAFSPSS